MAKLFASEAAIAPPIKRCRSTAATVTLRNLPSSDFFATRGSRRSTKERLRFSAWSSRADWFREDGSRWISPRKCFKNLSDIEIQEIYRPDDLKDLDYEHDLNRPGEFPFTRGDLSDHVPRKTLDDAPVRRICRRQKKPTGVTVIFSNKGRPDYPSPSTCRLSWATTPMIRVAEAKLEVRRRHRFPGGHGNALSRHSLDRVSVSMTINGPAIVSIRDVSGGRRKAGRATLRDLRGTLQNDILKEYIAQKEWIYPPAPSLKMIIDIVRVSAPNRCRATIRLASAATISAKPARPRFRNWLSLCTTD